MYFYHVWCLTKDILMSMERENRDVFTFNASEDLRPRTSHETDGKAVTRKRSGIAYNFFFQAIVAL